MLEIRELLPESAFADSGFLYVLLHGGAEESDALSETVGFGLFGLEKRKNLRLCVHSVSGA